MCHQLARLIDDQWLHLVAPLYGTSNSFGWSVTMAGPPRHVPLQPWVMFHWTMEEGYPDNAMMTWSQAYFGVIPTAKQLRYLFWWQHNSLGFWTHEKIKSTDERHQMDFSRCRMWVWHPQIGQARWMRVWTDCYPWAGGVGCWLYNIFFWLVIYYYYCTWFVYIMNYRWITPSIHLRC